MGVPSFGPTMQRSELVRRQRGGTGGGNKTNNYRSVSVQIFAEPMSTKSGLHYLDT